MAPEKAPAFQFYPKDFLSSSRVGRMSYTEIGVYTILLCHAWLSDGLPANTAELARLVRMPKHRFDSLWRGPLAECFVEQNGRLVNSRQEGERRKQADFRKRQTDAAASRWHRSGTSQTDAIPSPISSLQSPEEQKISEEPKDDSPPFLTFPTIGKTSTWDLSTRQVLDWQGLFPPLDVKSEMRTAVAWCHANPEKRKTAKGMPRFLVGWLTRAADRGGARVAARKTPDGPDRYGHVPPCSNMQECRDKALAEARAEKVIA